MMSILSGALLALTFPKFDQGWLAWVALVPFFIALHRSKRFLPDAFFFGLTFFGIHLFWITSLARFVGGWAWLGWGGLTLFQTLFIILFAAAFRHSALWIALWWVVIEWLRAWGPFGVTGGILGYSQAQLLPLIQVASFSSVYGVSFLVALINASMAQFIINRKRWPPLFLSVILIFILFFWGNARLNTAPHNPHSRIKLALLQPNIDQVDKLDPAKAAAIFEVHRELSIRALDEKPDVIIWPETAVFAYLFQDQRFYPRFRELVINSRAWFVVGTPYYDQKGKVYNSIVSVSPSGEVISRYDKQRRVPFGEYLPFRKILFPFLKGVGYYDRDFDRGEDFRPLYAKGNKIAPAICFESTFPELIKKRVDKNSAFILTVTNDAWFGNSSAPYFHLNAGKFRAIENRKYFVQVGNTGISAIIDPLGRVIKQTQLNAQSLLTVEIPLP